MTTQSLPVLRSIQRALLAFTQRVISVSRRVLPNFVKRRIAHLSTPVVSAIATPIGAGFARRRIALAEWSPIFPKEAFASGPIILANDALAGGGAERQIVNTLHGLEERHLPIGMLCLRLHETAELDFFLPDLKDFSGFVRNAISTDEAEAKIASITQPGKTLTKISSAISWLPLDIQLDVMRFIAEFAIQRPLIVHGWQDATSIAVAFAAWIVGVPRILVSSRNAAPTNFSFFRAYMLDGYREIASCPSIIMINNSEAGARDYANWLGVPVRSPYRPRNGIGIRAAPT